MISDGTYIANDIGMDFLTEIIVNPLNLSVIYNSLEYIKFSQLL